MDSENPWLSLGNRTPEEIAAMRQQAAAVAVDDLNGYSEEELSRFIDDKARDKELLESYDEMLKWRRPENVKYSPAQRLKKRKLSKEEKARRAVSYPYQVVANTELPPAQESHPDTAALAKLQVQLKNPLSLLVADLEGMELNNAIPSINEIEVNDQGKKLLIYELHSSVEITEQIISENLAKLAEKLRDASFHIGSVFPTEMGQGFDFSYLKAGAKEFYYQLALEREGEAELSLVIEVLKRSSHSLW